jgi:hypothetical protein
MGGGVVPVTGDREGDFTADLLDVLERLPVLLREKRWRLGLSARAAGEESGIGFPSWRALEESDSRSPLPFGHVLAAVRWVTL